VLRRGNDVGIKRLIKQKDFQKLKLKSKIEIRKAEIEKAAKSKLEMRNTESRKQEAKI
jgi:cell division protein FtsL